jgi:hypothetical protein
MHLSLRRPGLKSEYPTIHTADPQYVGKKNEKKRWGIGAVGDSLNLIDQRLNLIGAIGDALNLIELF